MPTRAPLPSHASRRAVAYLRLSFRGADDGSKERYGLEAQREAIRAWARQHGYRMVAWYEDHDMAGDTPPDQRPGLLQAVLALRRLEARVLLVARRDRIARDVIVSELVKRLVEGEGGVILSTDGLSADAGPQGDLLRGIVDVFSQYERALIRDRTRRALAARAARGLILGNSPPYGYTVDSKGRLRASAHEQMVMRQAEILRNQGVSWWMISRALANAGLLSRKGTPFEPTALRRMIERLRAGAPYTCASTEGR